MKIITQPRPFNRCFLATLKYLKASSPVAGRSLVFLAVGLGLLEVTKKMIGKEDDLEVDMPLMDIGNNRWTCVIFLPRFFFCFPPFLFSLFFSSVAWFVSRWQWV